jgi:hypothetical protein
VLALVLGCDSSSNSPQPGTDVAGCDGAKLLANPEDLAARGPWSVGAHTVSVGRLTVEVWYPAPPSSAVLEATLQCQSQASLSAIQSTYPAVSEYAEEL